MLHRLSQRLQSQNLRISLRSWLMAMPAELRRDFERLVAQIAEGGYVPDAVFAEGEPQGIETIGEFLGRFVGCEEVLRNGCRAAVEGLYLERFGGAPAASRFASYASAARRIAEVRRGVSGLAGLG